MSLDKNVFSKAYKLWSSFKEEVLYKNRFIIKHEVLEYLQDIAEKSRKSIEVDTILYRARIFTGDDEYIQFLKTYEEGLDHEAGLKMAYYKSNLRINTSPESGFWGYDERESFVPPSNDFINEGRANPAFIKYLYAAEQPYTALVEVRPYLNSRVSVAQIRVKEDLNVANFSFESFEKLDIFEKYLMFLIMNDFSKPSDSDRKSYIPTQYVSEFIKTLGMDGVRFNSSLDTRGRNIIVFNYDKCHAVDSKLYEIGDICFAAKGIAPKNAEDLMHYKLNTHSKNPYELFLQSLTHNE